MTERMSPIHTTLTTPQYNRLDDIADKDPEAKVVGWYHNGPVIRRGNGRESRVLPNGRLNPLGSAQSKSMRGD